jgi:hypothetical protein
MREKLNGIQVCALEPDPKAEYFVKLWRLWEPAPRLMWQGKSTLHIQRFTDKKRGNHLSVITPLAYDWAEGTYRDVENDGSVVVEDYMMEIFKVE